MPAKITVTLTRKKGEKSTKAIETAMDYLRDKVVKVGVLGAKAGAVKDDSKLTLAEVASVNEFGGGNVPERSFLRSTAKEEEDKIRTALVNVAKRAAQGADTRELKRILDQIGAYAVGKVQQKIVDLRDPPNAKRTIERKGSDNPLIDTGQLRSSITYAIGKGKQ